MRRTRYIVFLLLFVSFFLGIYFYGLPELDFSREEKKSVIVNAEESMQEKIEIVDKNIEYFKEAKTIDGIKTLIDFSLSQESAPKKDDIRPLEAPTFVSVENASEWMKDGMLCALYVGDKGTKVLYPLFILSWHQIVFDEVDGRKIMLTYDPFSGSLLSFDREVNGEILDFGVSGKIFNSNSLLYDKKKESFWQQINGMALTGDYLGEKLYQLPLNLIDFAEAKKSFFDAKVLSRFNTYNIDYSFSSYGNYEKNREIYFKINNLKTDFHPKAIGIGLFLDKYSKFYLLEDIRKKKLFNDNLGGTSMVFIQKPETKEIFFFEAEKNRIKYNFWLDEGKIKSKEGEWLYDNKYLKLQTEELDGIVLERIPVVYSYFFSWMAFYPDSILF